MSNKTKFIIFMIVITILIDGAMVLLINRECSHIIWAYCIFAIIMQISVYLYIIYFTTINKLLKNTALYSAIFIVPIVFFASSLSVLHMGISGYYYVHGGQRYCNADDQPVDDAMPFPHS